jgi:2-haloacid dehalogenase
VTTARWATFDCYGTLIDWERGIADALHRLWPDADAQELLQCYHDAERRVQRGSHASYREVLADALRDVAAKAGLELGEPDALAESLPSWPAFHETRSALGELRRRGWRIAILSNTDPEFLDASIREIGVEVDELVTVREAGSYKPASGNWERFFEIIAADRGRHAHVAASIFHDIEPAAQLGLRAVWINRTGQTSDVPRAAELGSLVPLPDVLDDLVTA